MPNDRSIEVEVEVVGTVDEVWQAIATGPGISSWYVPHTVEGRAGGSMTASFGAAPEMQVQGRVAEWDPPARVVFDGGEGVEAMAFEWTVEAKEGGTCIVRLVNSGFASGEDWDDLYDAMSDGWQIFLFNLRLHLEHFAGQDATAMLPMSNRPGPREKAWASLAGALGVPADVSVGDQIEVDVANGPAFAGTVARATPWHLILLLDQPAPGTAFVAAEGRGEQAEISIWAYLYGPDAEAIAQRDEPRWQQWLTDH